MKTNPLDSSDKLHLLLRDKSNLLSQCSMNECKINSLHLIIPDLTVVSTSDILLFHIVKEIHSRKYRGKPIRVLSPWWSCSNCFALNLIRTTLQCAATIHCFCCRFSFARKNLRVQKQSQMKRNHFYHSIASNTYDFLIPKLNSCLFSENCSVC